MSNSYTPNSEEKVVIVTVPFVDEDTPLAAPAVLKAALMSSGIPAVGLDLNIEIYNNTPIDNYDIFLRKLFLTSIK